MENLIQWLMKIEHLATDIYSQAAVYFENNRQLRKFLVSAAEDEALHYQIMARVVHLYKTMPYPPQVISVDLETRNQIEKTLVDIREQLVAGSLTESIVLDKITTAEFSEWNDVFIYVVSYLKEQDNDIKYAVAEIQTHLRFIENFLENTEYGRGLLGIKDRFIFLTGDHSRERLEFFKENRLRFLLKPASIRTIRNESLKVLLG